MKYECPGCGVMASTEGSSVGGGSMSWWGACPKCALHVTIEVNQNAWLMATRAGRLQPTEEQNRRIDHLLH